MREAASDFISLPQSIIAVWGCILNGTFVSPQKCFSSINVSCAKFLCKVKDSLTFYKNCYILTANDICWCFIQVQVTFENFLTTSKVL